jgi:tetratricopeptide (TPR) repeat protein/transglutaminase-like putative cysteine protease
MNVFKAVLLSMVLSATVLLAQDRRDWPRIMVILDEKIDNQEVDARLVASKIEEIFLEKGFRLVDKAQFENIRARDIALAEGDPARAKELGTRYGAELIIVGKSTGAMEAEKEFYGVKNFEYAAKGDCKVLITDTGELIAVSSKTSKKSASGKNSAADYCMGSLGEALANDLYVKIRMKLKEETTGTKTVQLAFIGLDQKLLSGYEKTLPQEIRMLERLKLRFLEKEAAVFEATVNGSIDDLRGEFAKRNDLIVVSFTGNRLDLSTKEFAERAKGTSLVTSPLEITEFTVENIFPSQVSYYAYNPLARIDIENSAKTEIKNVKVSIFIPGYMQLPSEQIVPRIEAGTKQSFELPVTLDAKQLYGLNENAVAQAKVELSYNYLNQPQSRSLVKPVTLYSRNTMNWKRSESIGAFVTVSDETVVNFARHVVGSIALDEKLKYKLPQIVVNAMAVWDGIRANGFNYVSDPWKASDADVLDVISYPRETIASRTGDCDDSSVLLVACMENIGIRTKFLATTDHIYMMFNTEIVPKNGYMLSQDEKEYIVHEGSLWIPLETTMINKSFGAAWRSGAEEYHKSVAENAKLEIIDTRKAIAAFPPINLSLATKPVIPPSTEKIASLASQDLSEYENHQGELTTAAVRSLAASESPEGKNKLAIVHAKAGNFEEAVLTLTGVATPQAENTLGNIYVLKNDLTAAQEHYQKSLDLNKEDGGVYLNFGLGRYLAGFPDDAVEAFTVAMSKYPSPEKAYEVLGLEHVKEALGMRGADKTTKKISKDELFDLLNKSLQNIPDKQKSNSQAAKVREKYKNEQNRFVFGGRRGADPTQIASIKEFLYWRE